VPSAFPVERDGRRFYLGDHRAYLGVQAAVKDLNAMSRPGERLLVGPLDLRRTWYSDVFIYWLFPELKPATYYVEMDPGLANAPGSSPATSPPRTGSCHGPLVGLAGAQRHRTTGPTPRTRSSGTTLRGGATRTASSCLPPLPLTAAAATRGCICKLTKRPGCCRSVTSRRRSRICSQPAGPAPSAGAGGGATRDREVAEDGEDGQRGRHPDRPLPSSPAAVASATAAGVVGRARPSSPASCGVDEGRTTSTLAPVPPARPQPCAKPSRPALDEPYTKFPSTCLPATLESTTSRPCPGGGTARRRRVRR
jgi:hypothetical protein